MWGTDQECKLRQPDDPFYKKFAAECSRVQIAIDIFVMGCAFPLLRADAGDLCWGACPPHVACLESRRTRRCSHCTVDGKAAARWCEQCMASAGAEVDVHHPFRHHTNALR